MMQQFSQTTDSPPNHACMNLADCQRSEGAPVHEQKELRMQRKAPVGAFCEWERLNCYMSRKQLGESERRRRMNLVRGRSLRLVRPKVELSEKNFLFISRSSRNGMKGWSCNG
jgi:hypothetical protein